MMTRGTQAVAMVLARFGRTIPAIIISGNRSASLRDETGMRGCGFPSKPMQPAKLRAMMSYVRGGTPA